MTIAEADTVGNIHRFIHGLFYIGLLASAGGAAADTAKTPDCAIHEYTFDGTVTLQYSAVKGAGGDRVALYHQYPSSCGSSTGKLCAGVSYVLPGEAVAVGGECGSWTYVQYIGEKHVRTGWVESGRLEPLSTSLPFDGGIPGGQDPKYYPSKWRISVRLVKGQGVPVCEAYVQRLNQTWFYEPPFCGRPENDQVPGFGSLHRVTLRPMEVNRLAVSRTNVSAYPETPFREKPNAMELAAAAETKYVYLDVGGYVPAVPRAANVSVWRYVPPLDMDNDGVPDNVIIWRDNGLPIWDTCGEPTTHAPGGTSSGPIPYVLSADNASIDVPKTTAMFGDAALPPQDDNRVQLGYSVSVFKYRGEYYFDAFMDHDTAASKPEPPEYYRKSLYVFQRKAGQLLRACRVENADYDDWRLR